MEVYSWEDYEYPEVQNFDWREVPGGVQRALWWVNQGFTVIPLNTNKIPRVKGWQDPKGEFACKTLDDVERVFGNFKMSEAGILLQASQLIVVDLDVQETFDEDGNPDPQDGDYNGIKEFAAVIQSMGYSWDDILSLCWAWRTPGRSGGMHLVFKAWNQGLRKHCPAPGIETLGVGRQVFAPCGKRADGKTGYRLLTPLVKTNLAVPPRDLQRFLSSGQGGHGGAHGGQGRAGRGWTFNKDGLVVAGGRHEYSYACAVAAACNDEDIEQAIKESFTQCAPPLDLPAKEIERMVQNASNFAQGEKDKTRKLLGLFNTGEEG